jgi:hypothetical protein
MGIPIGLPAPWDLGVNPYSFFERGCADKER